ncbi:S24 family peptidase [Colwellia echini]|uniref:Peptidase S24/S26A/S26B/S26C domain-containing protein n=1 Tax=Colwellia echini TaxID=1982103 RepID=A0ABY3N0L2_9GAMM|nr:S24 family peptidase [Colwellia echini]TYK66864.1 hypothetical protein CWS31_003520 [Colwellia echini]
MIFELLNKLDEKYPFDCAAAQCDIPYKNSQPISLQCVVIAILRIFGLNLFKVTGESMAPAIPSGCFILSAKLLMMLPIKEGQTMVINHPQFGVIVKTVAMVDKNGFVWSRGANNNSLSVEQLGPVYKHQILGRVVRVFTPPLTKKAYL